MRKLIVSINMAISMDGKIATKSRGPMKLGTELDSKRMAELRAENDAVINGAGTFLAYPFPLLVKNERLVKARRSLGLSDHPISAIVSSRLEIPRDTPWEKSRETERWVFCGSRASTRKVLALEKCGVKVICGKSSFVTPREILDTFSKAGVKRLLVEGGGELNASFLEAGLVDKVHLTLTPQVIGGRDSPSWVEGNGFDEGKFPRFRLTDCVKRGHELYLTYARS
jgi:riboflavin-specific deaminase-like protein